jgi:hypothetical protein
MRSRSAAKHSEALPVSICALTENCSFISPAGSRSSVGLLAITTRRAGAVFITIGSKAFSRSHRAGREVIPEVRDISAPNAHVYLSPLYDFSQQGLVDITCLLGYFQHNGEKTDKMLFSLARVTVFVPFLADLYRFLEGEELSGLNIIPITAALHTILPAFCQVL